MKKLFYLVIAVLMMSTVVLADYIIGGPDSGTYTRFTDDFRQVWQTLDNGVQISVSPVTGDIYVGYTGDIIKRFNRSTGVDIAPNSGAPYQAKHDLEWGYDFNGDGVQDIWTVKNDTTLGYIQVTNGANLAQNLASFALAPTNGTTLDGTGGHGCCFGPDLNGDGINDFYAVIGWNDQYCRINVWNPVALKTATTPAEIQATRIASYPAASLREPIDIILGPDFNKDGRRDLWVTSQYGNNLVIYDYTNGTELGTSTLGGLLSSWRQPRPLDIENGPNGTVLVTTRFATTLDPGYVAGAETQKGNLLQYDPKTDTTRLLYGSAAIKRFDSVVYFPDGIYAPSPTDGARVATTLNTLSWTNPDPNNPVSGVITCDVYFSTNYPDYRMYPNPDISGMDPNLWYVENGNFMNYATKVVNNQPVSSLNLSSITTVPLTYGQKYYWRVDTRDSSDPNAGTITGKVLMFTADNTPPSVNAGSDVAAWLTNGTVTVQTAATTSDDGKPNPPAAYTLAWTLDSGTASAVTINSSEIEDTTITITATGTYIFRLTANDSALSAFDFVTVTVYADACAAAKAQTGYTALTGDVNSDCTVNMADFVFMAANWLDSTALQ